MRCSRHAWTGPAAERQAGGDGATAPAPAGAHAGRGGEGPYFGRLHAPSCSSSGSRPRVSPPHPALCLRPTPVRADGYIRARWHISTWMRFGLHLRAPGPTYITQSKLPFLFGVRRLTISYRTPCGFCFVEYYSHASFSMHALRH